MPTRGLLFCMTTISCHTKLSHIYTFCLSTSISSDHSNTSLFPLIFKQGANLLSFMQIRYLISVWPVQTHFRHLLHDFCPSCFWLRTIAHSPSTKMSHTVFCWLHWNALASSAVFYKDD